jgi:hypothetical protein
MDLTNLSLILSAVAIIISVIAFLNKSQLQKSQPPSQQYDSTPIRLQAYERLVLLTERISLPNLISRLNQPGIPAADMKLILTENIKQEFEYNSTQQLYVTPVSWDAVRNLKEQNIMIINQVSAAMPPGATAADLNKKILEVTMSQPNGALHDMVLQSLNFEAKKLMK